MQFDGMGSAILNRHLPRDSFFRANKLRDISSVFPPTTAAATVSLESGLSPIEHGWLGWCLYFAELGTNVNIFPNTLAGSGGVPAAPYHVAGKFMPYEVGDYLAVAAGRLSIEYTGGKGRPPFKAAHAGLTADEMTVPLIVKICHCA
jgi:hypothetical protein